MRRIAAALLLLPCIASGATPTRTVSEGFLVVDGTWIEAPLALVFRANPPGVYVGQSLVRPLPDFFSDLGFQPTPPTDGFPESRVSRDARVSAVPVPEAVSATRGVAERVTTFILDRFWDGQDADAVRLELGRFLLNDPEPAAAEVAEDGVHIDFDVKGDRALHIPPVTPAWEASVRRRVDEAFSSVERATREGFVSGVPAGSLPSSAKALFDSLRVGLTDPGAVAWAREVLAFAADASIVVPAFHGFVATRFSDAFVDSAAMAPYPAGRRGMRVLADRDGSVALAAEGVNLSDVVDRLEDVTGTRISLPFQLRERRVHHRSHAFEPVVELVRRLVAPEGASVSKEPEGVRIDTGAVARIVAGGTALWHLPLEASRGYAWGVVMPPVVLFGGDAGVDATDWRRGKRMWRLDLTGAVFPPVFDEESVYLGTSDGRLASVRIRNGRVEWWGTLTDDASPLAGRHTVRPLAVTRKRLIVLQGADRLVVLEREEGRSLDTVSNPFEPPAERLSADAIVVAIEGGIVAFDDAGEFLGGRAVSGMHAGPTHRSGGAWIVHAASELLAFDDALADAGRMDVSGTPVAVMSDRIALAHTNEISMSRAVGGDAQRMLLPARVAALYADGDKLLALGDDGVLVSIDAETLRPVGVLDVNMAAHAHPAAHGGGFFGVDASGRMAAFRTP